jgi:hypothetical protein
MGWISKRHMQSGGSLNGDPKNNGSDSGPLKKIVGTCRVGYATLEALECGHLQMPKSDMMGHTNASRRRCKKCKRGVPVHFIGNPPSDMKPEDYQKVESAERKPLSPP